MSLKNSPSEFPSVRPQEIIEICPSWGDPPPRQDYFPCPESPPLLEEFLQPGEVLPDQSLNLDFSLPMRDRWLSLKDPPDTVAANIATEGLWLDLLQEPPMVSRFSPPMSVVTHPDKFPVLKPVVRDWEQRGILTRERIPANVFFSRLFYVSKKGGKFRPILDLSILNTYVRTPSFVMEDLDFVLQHITQVMWASTLDVTDAYLTTPIHPRYQALFCFVLDGVVYMFLRMPFGLTTAPWAFSRIMHPVKICLRMKGVSISSFIDDFFILAITQELCSIHAGWAEQILIWLGFQINYAKSSLVPLQSVEYLGILIDLRLHTHVLPPDKVSRLLDACRQMSLASWTTRRRLEALVGFLNFAHPFLSLGRMHLRQLIKWMNLYSSPASRDRRFPTNPELGMALRPFLDASYLATPTSFRPIHPSLVLSTDASSSGWSGVVLPFRVRDFWMPWEISNSINWREMAAILRTVDFLRLSLAHRSIKIVTDSLVVFFCLKRMGSLHSESLNDLLRAFLLLCQEYSITFVPVHISGSLNVLADQGSRNTPISTEWSLDPESFDWIFHQFPFSPQVDLFATRENFQFFPYVSPCPDPDAFFINALDLDWNRFQCIYAFPPPVLMDRIIDQICSFQGTMLLIAPLAFQSWTYRLTQRAALFRPLPQGFFLMQWVNGQLVTFKETCWNLGLWLLLPKKG